MSEQVPDALLAAIGMALKEDRERADRRFDELVKATGMALAEDGVKISAAVEAGIGRAKAAAIDLVRPALDVAEARRAAIVRRRSGTIETVTHWLRRVVDDTA